jgi:hypothetical protein
MYNIYDSLRLLAKSSEFQNLFYATKEINGLQLFENVSNLSRLQLIFLNYLYIYDSIQRDIITHNISKEIYKSSLREDCYLLWRKTRGFKEDKKLKGTAFELPISKTIYFPKKEVK